ncbi:MAG TPA: PDZ domain-containing protein, partial [Rhodanobacter sp.]
MRFSTYSLCALLLTAPFVHAQNAPAPAASAPEPPTDLAPTHVRADAPAKADDNHPVNLEDIRRFSRVYDIVRQAYVEPVSNHVLMKDAITGMLAGLDPHSEYLDKEGLAQLDEDTTGQYSGLGIEVLQQDVGLLIVTPIDDTPASRAGIKPGDSIVKIDGVLVDPQNVDDMFKKLRGKPGSKITLTVLHKGGDTPVD